MDVTLFPAEVPRRGANVVEPIPVTTWSAPKIVMGYKVQSPQVAATTGKEVVSEQPASAVAKQQNTTLHVNWLSRENFASRSNIPKEWFEVPLPYTMRDRAHLQAKSFHLLFLEKQK